MQHLCFNTCAYATEAKTGFQKVTLVFKLNLIPNVLIECLVRIRHRDRQTLKEIGPRRHVH